MANPATARAFAQALDPEDEADFYVFVNQGAPDATPAPVLLPGEWIASYSLTLSAEAAAVGLEIVADGARAPQLVGNRLEIWLTVADEMRGNAAFAGAGITVGISLTIVTTADPARTKERTFLVRIAEL